MSEADDIEREFREYLENQDATEEDQTLVRARTMDGTEEAVWDAKILDEDTRLAAGEIIALATSKTGVCPVIHRLSEQPPLYARYVVERAVNIVSQYVLHTAADEAIPGILGALWRWIRIARRIGIIDPTEWQPHSTG